MAAAVALLLTPEASALSPALRILPAWMGAAALIASVSGLARMASRGVDSPFAHLRRVAARDRVRLSLLASIILLAGLNMVAFMWIKPLLNRFVAFRADPMLAAADRMLFLGHDPWRLLQW
ncbi:MAG TPA: hypothetical protein VF636_04320, partial [Sphingomonas sp.]